MKFLIIGGDAAGMSAASKVKRLNSEIDVTVLEKTQDVSYSACGMPYNIADPQRDMEKLVVRKASVFKEKNNINLLTGYRVNAIDRASQKVTGRTLDDKPFEFDYDKLFIATGATPVIPDIKGCDLPEVTILKSFEDGKRIKSFIKENNVKKAVIIGMGYIALEMCEAFRKRGIETDMVKPGPVFLPWLTERLADVIQNELEKNQVRIYAGHQIEEIRSLTKGVSVISEKLSLSADMVLVASGVIPCSEIAGDAGLKLGVGEAIAVDKYLKTSDDNIYAAGDCADAYHVVTNEKCWIPLALRANRAGWAVADNICGKQTALPGVAGTSVFKVFSLEVARTGLTIEEARHAGFEPVENGVKTRSRAHGQPDSTPIHLNMVGDKNTGRLLGVQMVGHEGVAHRINAIAVALHNKMTVEQFFETDLAYAPPFGPVWDPLLTAANQLLKKLQP